MRQQVREASAGQRRRPRARARRAGQRVDAVERVDRDDARRSAPRPPTAAPMNTSGSKRKLWSTQSAPGARAQRRGERAALLARRAAIGFSTSTRAPARSARMRDRRVRRRRRAHVHDVRPHRASMRVDVAVDGGRRRSRMRRARRERRVADDEPLDAASAAGSRRHAPGRCARRLTSATFMPRPPFDRGTGRHAPAACTRPRASAASPAPRRRTATASASARRAAAVRAGRVADAASAAAQALARAGSEGPQLADRSRSGVALGEQAVGDGVLLVERQEAALRRAMAVPDERERLEDEPAPGRRCMRHEKSRSPPKAGSGRSRRATRRPRAGTRRSRSARRAAPGA